MRKMEGVRPRRAARGPNGTARGTRGRARAPAPAALPAQATVRATGRAVKPIAASAMPSTACSQMS